MGHSPQQETAKVDSGGHSKTKAIPAKETCCQKLMTVKSIEDMLVQHETSELKRSLGAFELTMLGIGEIIGKHWWPRPAESHCKADGLQGPSSQKLLAPPSPLISSVTIRHCYCYHHQPWIPRNPSSLASMPSHLLLLLLL